MKNLTHVEFKKRLFESKPNLTLLSEYTNNLNKVLVKDKYGICKLNPHGLLRSKNISIQSSVDKDSYFINQSREIHGSKYEYDNIKYINSYTKLKVRCFEHGEFEILPKAHLRGQGCPKCGRIEASAKMRGKGEGGYNITSAEYYKQEWEKKDAIVYFIKCWDDDEIFYKIGITTSTVKDRFRNRRMPYRWEILKEIYTDLYDAVYLEKGLHSSNSEYSYTPLKDFQGITECFSFIYELKIEKGNNNV